MWTLNLPISGCLNMGTPVFRAGKHSCLTSFTTFSTQHIAYFRVAAMAEAWEEVGKKRKR